MKRQNRVTKCTLLSILLFILFSFHHSLSRAQSNTETSAATSNPTNTDSTQPTETPTTAATNPTTQDSPSNQAAGNTQSTQNPSESTQSTVTTSSQAKDEAADNSQTSNPSSETADSSESAALPSTDVVQINPETDEVKDNSDGISQVDGTNADKSNVQTDAASTRSDRLVAMGSDTFNDVVNRVYESGVLDGEEMVLEELARKNAAGEANKRVGLTDAAMNEENIRAASNEREPVMLPDTPLVN